MHEGTGGAQAVGPNANAQCMQCLPLVLPLLMLLLTAAPSPGGAGRGGAPGLGGGLHGAAEQPQQRGTRHATAQTAAVETACSAAAAAMHWVTAALTGTAMGHRRMPQRVAAARRIGQGEGASRRRLAAEAVKQGAQQAALHSRSAMAVTTGRERRQEMPASVVDHRGTQVPTEAVAVHRLQETEARVHPYVVASAWRQGVLAAHLAALVVGPQPREPPARVTVAERVRRQ